MWVYGGMGVGKTTAAMTIKAQAEVMHRLSAMVFAGGNSLINPHPRSNQHLIFTIVIPAGPQ
jgi:hypothetical protein